METDNLKETKRKNKPGERCVLRDVRVELCCSWQRRAGAMEPEASRRHLKERSGAATHSGVHSQHMAFIWRGGCQASTGRCLPSQSPAVPGQLGGRNYPGWISSRTWPEVTASPCQRALREVTGRRAAGCSAHLIYVRKTVRVFVCGNGFHFSHLSQRHKHI